MNKGSSNNNCVVLSSKIKIFSIGIFIGCIGGLFWQEVLAPIEIYPGLDYKAESEILRKETDEKLLKFIEGKWRSSIGDLIVEIKDSDINGSFVVLEDISKHPKREEKFKVIRIDLVDGMFGIVKLSLCKENNKCDKEEELIPVQFNKIFGIEKTITMSYDRRFAYCLEPNNKCVRAFVEID